MKKVGLSTDFKFNCLAATVVVATATTVVSAAAENNDEKNDDPAAVAGTESVTHVSFLLSELLLHFMIRLKIM